MVKPYLFFGIILSAICACTIKPPEVHITADKTALENQMFGEKARVSSDPSTSIAVWASLEKYSWEGEDEELLTRYRDEYNKRRLTLAQIRRKTMSGYIDELKRQGALGESYDGRMVIMSDSVGAENQIGKIVEAENNDREIILAFYFESRGIEDEIDKSGARIEFAQVMARLSPDGTWIEDYEGNWTVK
ncbi:MAG: DUF1318 domain-containing protein [Candidatus Zixiibacteriota bacterium]|nr:MAG: DUF1318 domain-containing protein [candidate division Zixibacteria bacterium]